MDQSEDLALSGKNKNILLGSVTEDIQHGTLGLKCKNKINIQNPN